MAEVQLETKKVEVKPEVQADPEKTEVLPKVPAETENAEVQSESEKKLIEKLPQNSQLDKVCEKSKKLLDLKNLIKSSPTVTEKMQTMSTAFLENSPEFMGTFTKIKNCVIKTVAGSTINAKVCDEMLEELKQIECKLAKQQVKVGDQAMAEVAADQARKLKKAWQTIKESCELQAEAKPKIEVIEEKMQKLEVMSKQIENLIKAFNTDKFDETKKKVILDTMKSTYNKLRHEYITAKSEIGSLKITIHGQIFKLHQVDDEQTDQLIQNIVIGTVQTIQSAVKGNARESTMAATATVGRIAENLDMKKKIKLTRLELEDLMKQLEGLEARLERVNKVKKMAKQFLIENGIDVE